MSRQIRQAAVFLGLIMVAATASAQLGTPTQKVDVPFPFVVENQTLPPGRYTVTPLSQQHVRIANSQNRGTFALVFRVDERRPKGPGMIVFNCYQGTCFLSQIWSSGAGSGKELYRSRGEKEMEVAEPSRYVAALRAQE
jgi:hypothetical protein